MFDDISERFNKNIEVEFLPNSLPETNANIVLETVVFIPLYMISGFHICPPPPPPPPTLLTFLFLLSFTFSKFFIFPTSFFKLSIFLIFSHFLFRSLHIFNFSSYHFPSYSLCLSLTLSHSHSHIRIIPLLPSHSIPHFVPYFILPHFYDFPKFHLISTLY